MDIFKEFVSSLNNVLKEKGFDKKGLNFYIQKGKNYGILNFQKSRESTREVAVLTINFGIYSDFLAKSDFDYSVSKMPEIDSCQWSARIGGFMPGTPDFWWRFQQNELNIIKSDVLNCVDTIVIPQLVKRLSDDDLLNSWLDNAYMGTTQIGRFKYLTTLLKAKGDIETLLEVVSVFLEESKGRPNVLLAKEHLREIGYNTF